jgi:hypothetical protein
MNTLSTNTLLFYGGIGIVAGLLLRYVLFIQNRRAAIQRCRARLSGEVEGLTEEEFAKELDPNGVASLEQKMRGNMSETSAAGLQKQWIAALQQLIVERQLRQIRWSSS